MSFDSSRSFLMSQRAADQGRNMHVFSLSCFPQARMAGGFNLNRIHLTAKTFYRWLYLCDEIINFQRGLKDAVVLRKIRLRTVQALLYAFEEIEGPPIPRDSLQLIEPGIYGIFSADGTPFTRYFCSPVRFHPSFKDQEVQLVWGDPSFKGENDIPINLKVLAGARDKGRCFITGRTDLPTQCVWILPPLATFGRDHSDPMAFDKYKVVDNLITICSALADPFMRNLFAVDVEDNTRIITFDDLPSGSPTLPSHLPTPPSPSTMDYWKYAFIYTLAIFFPAGEVKEDYSNPEYDSNDLIEELQDGYAELAHPKWQSDIGREALAVYWQLACPTESELRDERERRYATELDEDASDEPGYAV